MILWENDRAGVLNGVEFSVITENYGAHKTTKDHIVVLKPESYFTEYVRLLEKFRHKRLNIVELGIFEGGSTLMLADLFPNARILALDIRDQNDDVLYHLDAMGYSDRVALHYGVSQSDEAALKERISDFFAGETIDVVIDDASHMYQFSKDSFEILFPLQSPGGLYAIEDWAWAHWANTAFDTWDGIALSSLIMQFVMAVGSKPYLFSSLEVRGGIAVVGKGPDASQERLDLEAEIKTQPRTWQPLQLEQHPE